MVVRYRMLQQTDWSGRIVGQGLFDAVGDTRRLMDAARQRQFDLYATSVTRDWQTMPAIRVPELMFAATRPPLTRDVPQIGL